MEKTTYYFIRHAEKDQTNPNNLDPKLTSLGVERAVFWANFFSDKSLDMIYSTDFIRTKQTVAPLLSKTNLSLHIYQAYQLYSKEFLAETHGKNVLIVGHQISIPQAIKKITGEDRYKKIPIGTYGNLYTIILENDGSTTSTLEQPRR